MIPGLSVYTCIHGVKFIHGYIKLRKFTFTNSHFTDGTLGPGVRRGGWQARFGERGGRGNRPPVTVRLEM